MDVKLTHEQLDEFMTDGWINIKFGNYRIYMEIDPDNKPSYFEITHGKNEGYAYSMDELKLLEAKQPFDPSLHRTHPTCPNCGTNMIYQFENCPKCGQKLDWQYCEDDAK